jgi:hypothetical protein
MFDQMYNLLETTKTFNQSMVVLEMLPAGFYITCNICNE